VINDVVAEAARNGEGLGEAVGRTKDDPLYYFRSWKTLLCRTVAGEGQSFYFCSDHRQTISTL
jgi:hypothetical protein